MKETKSSKKLIEAEAILDMGVKILKKEPMFLQKP